MASAMSLEFPPYRLDLRDGLLYRGAAVVPLRPKAYALLSYFCTHAHAVLSKDTLLQSVWPERVISEAGLTELIRELRQALGDDARAPTFIKTVHGRGYRFIAGQERTTVTRAETYTRETASVDGSAYELGSSAVGRCAELESLSAWLRCACAGQRQLIFVTGEPGIGKTTLIESFLSRLGQAERGTRHSLWCVRGQCIEQYGAGEAYLPILEALGRLARQPEGQGVVAVLRQYAPTWLSQMPSFIDADDLAQLERRVQGATRERMLREMAEALETITLERPLVLVLEDLHWSDYSTLDLLSYVAQRQEPARLMILASFRPVEVYTRDHPLKRVKQELQTRGQCLELALSCLSEGAVAEYLRQRFAHIEALPALSRLAQIVHRRTDGHPLFMVNVADYMAALEFSGLPDSVEHNIPDSVRQTIERQIERLPAEAQRVLEVASVAGTEFSAAAVAAGLASEDIDAVEQACEDLARRAQFLLRRGSEAWPDGTLAARYGFIHALYQNVFYFRVTAGRRARLHQQIGLRVECAYGAAASELAAELALHFEEGCDYQRALRYLAMAGEKAIRQCANREAINLFQLGLKLLPQIADQGLRHRHELALLLALGPALIHARGYAAAEVADVYGRARALFDEVGEPPQLFSILWGLWLYYVVRGNHTVAYDIAKQLLELERRHSVAFPLAQYVAGCSQFWLGEIRASLTIFDHGLAIYDATIHVRQVSLYSQDARAVMLLYRAWDLWFLGYPDQARDSAASAIAWATELDHPFSLAFARGWSAVVHYLCRQPSDCLLHAETEQAISLEHGFPFWHAWSRVMAGWATVGMHDDDEGFATIETGLVEYQATGAAMGTTLFLAMRADACAKAGLIQQGLRAIDAAFGHVRQTNERAFVAELHRLRGELILLREPGNAHGQVQAERSFRTAIEVARRQGAKSWQLRATLSLANLWVSQGQQAQAYDALADIHRVFTEGFDTSDLKEASALLDSLRPAEVVRAMPAQELPVRFLN